MFKLTLPDKEGTFVEFLVTFVFPHKQRYIQNQNTSVCKIFKKVPADNERGYDWQQVSKAIAKKHSTEGMQTIKCPYCKKDSQMGNSSNFDKFIGRKYAFKNAVKTFTNKEDRTKLWDAYWGWIDNGRKV